jgi:hypothetical protein
MLPTVEASGAIIVHLAKQQERADHYRLLEESDIIFAQLVQDSFAVEHLTTSRLREQFGDRVVSWPNLFFSGQCPDLAYITASHGTRILGPMSEYHLKSVFAAWRAGFSVEACVRNARSGPSTNIDLAGIAESSLSELRRRETNADVSIADVIETEWRARRLFFTFNHPTTHLLSCLCNKLLNRIGLKPRITITSEIIGELLGRIVPPILDFEKQTLLLSFATSDACRGVQIKINEATVILGKPHVYYFEDYVEAAYRAYDAQRSRLGDDVRFTPAGSHVFTSPRIHQNLSSH